MLLVHWLHDAWYRQPTFANTTYTLAKISIEMAHAAPVQSYLPVICIICSNSDTVFI